MADQVTDLEWAEFRSVIADVFDTFADTPVTIRPADLAFQLRRAGFLPAPFPFAGKGVRRTLAKLPPPTVQQVGPRGLSRPGPVSPGRLPAAGESEGLPEPG